MENGKIRGDSRESWRIVPENSDGVYKHDGGPRESKKLCAAPNKKVSLAMYKNQMGLAAGTTEINFDVEHDSGRTCVDSSFTFTKARKG
ncbi:hypothetical protein NQ318_011174 [Aromia moschata]|uniref:Uncharacterized protein n=1 Tax=Aromia moschata TaxID=1265417 RepID=A0AAV8YK24_9CUCU|nr:hypothetical protein NQ318_011174 [Aromia moschata]